MQFNYNFPKVFFDDKKQSESALIYSYSYKDEQFVLGKNENKLKKYENYLNKKLGSVYGFYDGKEFIVLVNIKDGDCEKSIIKAISSVPEAIKNVSVCLAEENFYDKLLVSKVLFELKNDWSLKSKKEDKSSKNICFVVSNKSKYNSKYGENLAYAQAVVQQFVNMPANYLTPSNFGKYVENLVGEINNKKLTCEVHGKKYIKEKNMGSFLGVAKGSEEDPRLIVIQYKGNEESNENDVVLVGKGLTFDSGGISIKPSLGMAAMKTDMAGAATSVGSILYAAKSQLKLNMVVIAACCENMPDGKALKPSDVVTAMDGTTIEVIDTDAEGRLVLADALCYSKEFNGKYTIDMATLTGACIVALGHVHTGMFTKDDNLAKLLKDSGYLMKDKVWQLPLEEEHEEMLESKVADIGNLCIGKGAGAQNGAVFLQRFAPKNGWCHLDIAGTSASKAGEATSRPLAMISEFLDKL